jgi:quinoprotein glucose dehydrogenase
MLQQKTKQEGKALAALVPLLASPDSDIACQAIKVLGETKFLEAFAALTQQLKTNRPRVCFEAALALSQLGKPEAVPALLAMIGANSDKDAYIRHAGVMALVKLANRDALLAASRDASPSVRLASLLAMRRLGMPDVARFVDDADQRIVLEAARAIVDQPIAAGLPKLATLIDRTGLPDPLIRRVINANFRTGGKTNAEALARFAGRSDATVAARREALACLSDWATPSPLDRTTGLSRPLPPRPASDAADALRAHLGAIFTGPDQVRGDAAKLAAKLGIKEVAPVLLEIAKDPARPAGVRVESLKALAALKDKNLKDAMEVALEDKDARLRTVGREILASLMPDKAIEELTKALDKGDISDRQGAFSILSSMKGPDADRLLETWLDRLLANDLAPELQLDLLEAAAKHKTPGIEKKLAHHEASRSPKDHLSKWSESLFGGDAEQGKRIFFERTDVSCLRCHKINGVGGEVGPELTGIGSKQKRDYLLESIVEPDKQIAKGYETVVVTLTDGKIKSGVFKSEDKKELRLVTPEGALLVVPIAEIDSRSRGPSAMPGDLVKSLTRRDLRDLVEFLANLK